jgi:hypothetical protein
VVIWDMLLGIAELDKMIKRKNKKSSLLDKTITLTIDIILIVDLIIDLTSPMIDLDPVKGIDPETIIIQGIIDLNLMIGTLDQPIVIALIIIIDLKVVVNLVIDKEIITKDSLIDPAHDPLLLTPEISILQILYLTLPMNNLKLS